MATAYLDEGNTRRKIIDNEQVVQSSALSTTAYGTWPANYYLEGTATESVDTTVMYTSGTASSYNRFTLGLTVLGATSVTVAASIDGTTYTDVRLFDASTGAVFATNAITAIGTYYLDGKYKNIRLTLAGTGATTVIFNHGVM